MKSSSYKRGQMFSIRISGEKFENLFMHDLFYNIVQMFNLWLHKSVFIMTFVAQVSNVANGPLVLWIDAGL